MGTTSQQIEAHIEQTREDLGSNLEELEQKVKSVTDWKQHFQTKPMTMLGVAFGAGAVFAVVLGKGRRGGKPRSFRHEREPLAHAGRSMREGLGAWDKIKGALIGVAATRLVDYADALLPGVGKAYRNPDSKSGYPN